jgi:GNAT superfamily N-acetyltransferase
MTIAELERRMSDWLKAGEYQAVLFECDGRAEGYALFRRDTHFIYLRQFFVRRECRRKGKGRAAFQWLKNNAWTGNPRIRLDVLVGNAVGHAFWRSVGFQDYCMTMELF